MKIKIPTFNEILNFMCSYKVRMITILTALVIFILNLILICCIDSYKGLIGNLIGWFIIFIAWITNYLYNNKSYGHQEQNWQNKLKEKYSDKSKGGYID